MTSRRLAVFVEGQTEAIFVEKLLSEVIGQSQLKALVITHKQTRQIKWEDNEVPYQVLIVDCHGDGGVKSRILDNRKMLIKGCYEFVLGLRDIHPVPRANTQRLEQGLRTGVPTKDLKIVFCLARMETEAWFLQDASHFTKIDPRLTVEKIHLDLGFNPLTHSAEDIELPAEFLKMVYQLVNKTYDKSRSKVQRTVEALDYDELYSVLPNRLPSLKAFLHHIDEFLGKPLIN